MAPCGNGCFWHVASVHGEAAQGPESENTADLSLCERRLAVGEKEVISAARSDRRRACRAGG
jgi:hypothetical protein